MAICPEIDYFLEENPSFVDALFPHWNDYIPHCPTPKQTAFLMLPYLEAFFGGAAGGGKTDMLCQAALQYADVPNYSGIIFRKTHTDHLLEKSPGDRILQWISQQRERGLINRDDGRGLGVSFDQSLMKFTFYPSRASLLLGYIGQQGQYTRYQGSEFQFIGWDELAQHTEEDYLWMFSRLRKTACPIHKTHLACEDGSTETKMDILGQYGKCGTCGKEWFADGSHTSGYHKGDPIYVEGCSSCDDARCVPLRIRSTSNPPAMGERGANNDWIKRRFSIKKCDDGKFRGTHPTRFYMPSYVGDNPHVSQNDYAATLSNLDPVTRDQLLRGDWSVQASGRFRREWIKRYTFRRNEAVTPPPEYPGEYNPSDFFILGAEHQGNVVGKTWLRRQCICFSVCDPAASAKSGPGDEQIFLRKQSSWTVISTFLLTPDWHLIWLDMVRFQEEIPSIVPALTRVYNRLRPDYFVIEANGLNVGVEQYARAEGLLVRPYYPNGRGDILVRATDAIMRVERGQVWFPSSEPDWLEACQHEVFTWTGHPHERDDIISTLSMAAHEVSRRAMSRESKPTKGRRAMPIASGGIRF